MPDVEYTKVKAPAVAAFSPSKRPSMDSNRASTVGKGLVLEFECEDTGSGIPEHLQQDIFKPFVQGDLALSKKHGGVGLGLAICSQLASMVSILHAHTPCGS
jgi:signal transduction histidine kinase